MSVAGVLSLALFVGFGYGWDKYRSLNSHVHTLHIAGLGGALPKVAGVSPKSASFAAQNILIVGDDSREGVSQAQGSAWHVGNSGDVESTSTDTLILLHIPANGGAASMVSIPRDSYVAIPGFSKYKINAAYVDGYDQASNATPGQRQAAGAALLIQTVKNLTGVPINHYVQVGFAGFEDLAQAIGSLPVNLCESVNDKHYSGFVMSAGQHSLNATQMLEFVRQRHGLPQGDINREDRQRYFLSQAFKQVMSAGILFDPSALNKVIEGISKSIIIDDQFKNGILGFGDEMATITASKIKGATIPNSIGPDVPGVGDVIAVSPAKVQAYVQALFYGAPTSSAPHPATAPPTAPSTAASHPSSTSAAPSASCIQ